MVQNTNKTAPGAMSIYLARPVNLWRAPELPVVTAIFVAVGIVLTVGFEYYYTNISLRWTYSELMPLVPPLGTGLSPLLQWLVIPSLLVWLTRRHLVGAQTIDEADA